ncbi:MAG: hypothetical protein HY811_12030 [Planctomycetes bacterium]|nr:hypothetical protein [Planctomycetota bacterium]
MNRLPKGMLVRLSLIFSMAVIFAGCMGMGFASIAIPNFLVVGMGPSWDGHYDDAAVPEIKDEPLTPAAEKRIKELIPQLNAEEWQDRENAMEELIKMGKMVIPFAIEAYNSSEPEVKMRAKKILNTTGGWIRIPALAEERIRALLSEIDTKDLRPEYLVDSWSLRYYGALSSYQLQRATADLYKGLKSAGSEVVPALVKNLETTTEPINKAILLYIIGKLPSKESTSAVAKMVNDSNDSVKYLALDALGKLKDENAVPELIKAGQSSDENMRILAYGGLSNYRTKEATNFLLKGLSDDNPMVRVTACSSLSRISSGERFGYNPYDSKPSRAAAVACWQKWIEEQNTKPAALKPPKISAYLALRNVQKIKDAFLSLPCWEEDSELKNTATQLYEMYLPIIAQETGIPAEVARQLIDSVNGIQIAYYGSSEAELKGKDDLFHKQTIPNVFAEIAFDKPDQLKELFAGPLAKYVFLKEKLEGNDVFCIKPGIWAWINERGLALGMDKEIFKGMIISGGLEKRMQDEEHYRFAKERLGNESYLWGYMLPGDLIASSFSPTGRGSLRGYLQFESATDLTRIKSYCFGVTIKDNRFSDTEIIRLDPGHGFYKIICSKQADQKSLLKMMPADSFFTATWSFSKDSAKIWEEGFKYILSKANDFGEDDTEEEIIEEMTNEMGSKPEDIFGQVNQGAGVSLSTIGRRGPTGFVIFPAKDAEKAKETVKGFDRGKFGQYKETEHNGVKIYGEDKETPYSFFDNNFIMGFERHCEPLKNMIDTAKEGKTMDKLLASLEKEGLKPEAVNNASLLIVLNLHSILGMLKDFGMRLPVPLEAMMFGVEKDTVVVGTIGLDKPDEINVNFWSNLKISKVIHGALKIGSQMMGGGEGSGRKRRPQPKDDDEEDMEEEEE